MGNNGWMAVEGRLSTGMVSGECTLMACCLQQIRAQATKKVDAKMGDVVSTLAQYGY